MFKNFFLRIFEFTDVINNKIFIYKIDKLPFEKEISLLDLGSSFGIEPRWKKVSKYLKYYGCEPNIKFSEKKNKNFLSYKIFPFIIGKKNLKKKININICKNPGVSSIFTPNYNFLKLFLNWQRFKIIYKKNFFCKSIDSLKLNNIDFMKLDLQGAELDALKGSKNVLKQLLGLEVEVEFQEIYQKQPLYGDINKFLINKKFDFNDFVYIARHERNKFSGFGQSIFANALYLKSPEFVNKNVKNKKKIINYILICLLYNKFDLINCLKLEIFFSSNEILKLNETINFFRKKNKIARFVSSITTGITRVFGNEYKSHLFN